MLKINLTAEAVEYLKRQRVLTKKLKHSDVEWYSFLLFNFIASQIRPFLTKGQRCLDIGSGLGLVNIFLRDMFDEIWLYDKTVNLEDLDKTFYGFHENYCFYNNMYITKSLNLDFNVTENLDFPDSYFDMIHSHMSWCWHYPKQTYYETVLRLLKPGGILIVDVWTKQNYNFDEFELLDRLENREDESFKLILKRKN
jgi:SAM-dependent methyltransferase